MKEYNIKECFEEVYVDDMITYLTQIKKKYGNIEFNISGDGHAGFSFTMFVTEDKKGIKSLEIDLG